MKLLTVLFAFLVCFLAVADEATTETNELTETTAAEATVPVEEAPAPADEDYTPETVVVEVPTVDFCEAHADAIALCADEDATADAEFCDANAEAIAECVAPAETATEVTEAPEMEAEEAPAVEEADVVEQDAEAEEVPDQD